VDGVQHGLGIEDEGVALALEEVLHADLLTIDVMTRATG
jgi:hypothetical protein